MLLLVQDGPLSHPRRFFMFIAMTFQCQIRLPKGMCRIVPECVGMDSMDGIHWADFHMKQPLDHGMVKCNQLLPISKSVKLLCGNPRLQGFLLKAGIAFCHDYLRL